MDFPRFSDIPKPHNEAASKASGLTLGARVEFECIAALR
jgi:enamine deaminase RidA (YjgF/YER057c/UK114 family)